MISIIIPTLNEEKVIEKTLSVFSQCSLPHEIIISDGWSKDKTVSIAQTYTSKIISHQGVHRQTIAEARNLGASLAQGEFFVFLDADVIIPDPRFFFQTLIDSFIQNPQRVAATVCQRALPEVETRADQFFFKAINMTLYCFNNLLWVGWASWEFQMIRASAFKQCWWYNTTLAVAEDNDLFRRLAKKGKTTIMMNLFVMHPVRRAHQKGWITLIIIWRKNQLSVILFKRSYDTIWEEIR